MSCFLKLYPNNDSTMWMERYNKFTWYPLDVFNLILGNDFFHERKGGSTSPLGTYKVI